MPVCKTKAIQKNNDARYGEKLLPQLAKRLTEEFGKGFDQRNSWYMRSFYGYRKYHRESWGFTNFP